MVLKFVIRRLYLKIVEYISTNQLCDSSVEYIDRFLGRMCLGTVRSKIDDKSVYQGAGAG